MKQQKLRTVSWLIVDKSVMGTPGEKIERHIQVIEKKYRQQSWKRLIVSLPPSKIAILTRLANVVIPRVEMPQESITGSLGRGPKFGSKSPQKRIRKELEKYSAFDMIEPNRLDITQDRSGDSHNGEKIEDGNLLVWKSNYAQQMHTHHS